MLMLALFSVRWNWNWNWKPPPLTRSASHVLCQRPAGVCVYFHQHQHEHEIRLRAKHSLSSLSLSHCRSPPLHLFSPPALPLPLHLAVSSTALVASSPACSAVTLHSLLSPRRRWLPDLDQPHHRCTSPAASWD
ncbi:hypothetical protein ZWY2020_046358 [Hordeum vulgare]|nr:hypothetical protein ZWY2020_046358 [Hordeum vulgare]